MSTNRKDSPKNTNDKVNERGDRKEERRLTFADAELFANCGENSSEAVRDSKYCESGSYRGRDYHPARR